jgi:pyruvate ferredoxin oxidoreductase gamma subunit
MKEITEIRWHGRAGQGTVSAAKVLADTALAAGRFVQAFPEYGPEREGAPVRAYNRIAKVPFSIYCEIEHPGVVIVPAEVKGKYGLGDNPLYTVDATGISLEVLGRNIPNTPVLGALARATGVVGLEGLLENVKEVFGKKLSPEIIEKNLQVVRRGFQEVRGV